MSWKLAAVLFTPILFIVPAVYWFSTRVQRKYRKQRESTGDIHAVLENLIRVFLLFKPTTQKRGKRTVLPLNLVPTETKPWGPAKTEIGSFP